MVYKNESLGKGEFMSLPVILLTALGLSLDAFAVAVCLGLSPVPGLVSRALITGLYFGLFQALMPLAGFFLGGRFAGVISRFDHWIAFIVLGIIGVKNIKEGLTPRPTPPSPPASLTPRVMLPLAAATSLDALAVGVSLALLDIAIVKAALLIGGVTFLMGAAGILLGRSIGARLGRWAEAAGGVILVGIGLRILLEHLKAG
jgi:putative Mn2+ efflux pump MntP